MSDKMKKELIKTDNYLLIVDDSEIKQGDCYLSPSGIWFYNYLNPNHVKECQKIIAHLPLNNSPILEGVPLLPPLEVEDDVEKLSWEYTFNKFGEVDDFYDTQEGFIDGYNKAREKYDSLIIKTLIKFDIEIKKHLLMYSIEHSIHGKMCDGINEIRSNIIQSLSQPKMPTHFEFEMEKDYRYNDDGEPIGFKVHDSDKIKTTINSTTTSQSQVIACGKYIYEL
jgi:hypothetical protein